MRGTGLICNLFAQIDRGERDEEAHILQEDHYRISFLHIL